MFITHSISEAVLLAEARAVEEGHLGQVDDDVALALGQKLVDGLTKELIAEPGGQLALEVQDDDFSGLADFEMHDRDILAACRTRLLAGSVVGCHSRPSARR